MKKISLFLALGLSQVAVAHNNDACKSTCAPKRATATVTQSGALVNPSLAVLKKHINGKKVVVVDIFASWCGPCKLMSPIIDALAQDTDLDVVFIKIEHDQEALKKYLAPYTGAIKSIPSFFIFKNGKVVDQFIGAMPQETLKKKIKTHTTCDTLKKNA